MNRLKATDFVILFFALVYIFTLLFRDWFSDSVLLNSIPSFTGAVVFSSIFRKYFSKKPTNGRLHQYTYSLSVLIILILDEVNQMCIGNATYDLNDVTGIVFGVILGTGMFELERKSMR